MAKKEEGKMSELEALAAKLESLAEEATTIGEDRVSKSIANAVKSCQWAEKQRGVRLKKVGGIVASLKSKGFTAEQIVARLTSGQG
jgi:hypothetical protein